MTVRQISIFKLTHGRAQNVETITSLDALCAIDYDVVHRVPEWRILRIGCAQSAETRITLSELCVIRDPVGYHDPVP